MKSFFYPSNWPANITEDNPSITLSSVMGGPWGPLTCRTSQTNLAGPSAPTTPARSRRRCGKCPTRTSAAGPTRQRGRTFPQTRPNTGVTGTRSRGSGRCGQTMRDAGQSGSPLLYRTVRPTRRGRTAVGRLQAEPGTACRNHEGNRPDARDRAADFRRYAVGREGEHLRWLAGRLRPSHQGRRPPEGEGGRTGGSRAG
jgi:hypothetical protein